MLLDEEIEFHKLKGVVRISDSRYEKPSQEEDKKILLGAPGTRIMEFEALSEGNGEVHLLLGKPFEVKA